MSRVRPRVALAAVLLVAGCASHGPAGLGRRACPYVRPRLLRIDRDRLASNPADLTSVARDIDLYVTQLPAGGKAKSDRKLAAFSAALDAYLGPAPSPSNLDAAEAQIKHLCGVVS